MPQETDLVQVLSKFMDGTGAQPIGLVSPPRTDAPNLPDKGARFHALSRFLDFCAALPFMRTMQGEPQAFRVPRAQMFVDQPDSVVGAPDGAPLPTLAFLTSENDDMSEEDGWLGPSQIMDETANVFAPNTVLFWVGDLIEDVILEVVSDKPAKRRAIIEGLKQALRSSDDGGALRLVLPGYFNQIATFTYQTAEYEQEPDAVRNRRRARLKINLYVPEVMLANAVTFLPFITVTTGVDVDTSGDVDADADFVQSVRDAVSQSV